MHNKYPIINKRNFCEVNKHNCKISSDLKDNSSIEPPSPFLCSPSWKNTQSELTTQPVSTSLTPFTTQSLPLSLDPPVHLRSYIRQLSAGLLLNTALLFKLYSLIFSGNSLHFSLSSLGPSSHFALCFVGFSTTLALLNVGVF